MEISEINELPTVINNVHESSYRSYQLLKKIIEFIERGDSHATMMEFYKFANESYEKIKLNESYKNNILKEANILFEENVELRKQKAELEEQTSKLTAKK